ADLHAEGPVQQTPGRFRGPVLNLAESAAAGLGPRAPGAEPAEDLRLEPPGIDDHRVDLAGELDLTGAAIAGSGPSWVEPARPEVVGPHPGGRVDPALGEDGADGAAERVHRLLGGVLRIRRGIQDLALRFGPPVGLEALDEELAPGMDPQIGLAGRGAQED